MRRISEHLAQPREHEVDRGAGEINGSLEVAPAPDCRVVCLQAAFAEQLFDIAERERVPKGRAHGTQNQLGLRFSPLEDRRSDCLLHDLFRLPAAVGQSCNTTVPSLWA